jgi:nucleoside-diphosphate-sugar epimerase
VTRVVVTGGSGKAGRSVIRDLVEHGFDVVNVDTMAPAEPVTPVLVADLTHYGETVEALRGADAVVHLAAIPAPRIRSAELTFRINVASTYNVFSAATMLDVGRVV